MTFIIIKNILFWSSLLNIGILLFVFLVFLVAHDWIYRLHARFFKISIEKFDQLNYTIIGLYKIGVFIFNIVPYIAMRIVEMSM